MAGALLHLVCGSTGAGKTTYAAALAGRLGAVLFPIDEWMNRLYWPDAAPGADPDWGMERITRATAQMRAVIGQLARLGVPSVADAGFTTRADRAEFADWAQGAGIAVQLHWLDVPREVRWARVEARNRAGGEGTGFEVTREMFDFVEGLWEASGAAEMAALGGIRLGAEGRP